MLRSKFMAKVVVIFWLIITSCVLEVKANEESFPPNRLTNDMVFEHFNLVGQAKFSFLFWDIYNSKLYTTSGVYPPEIESGAVLFEIAYLRDITAEDLLNRTEEQWDHLGYSKSEYRQYTPALKAMWPDISAGDTLTLLVQNEQASFYFNGIKLGFVAQEGFSQAFLAIWLSEKTSQPELRYALLGDKIDK